MNKKIYLLATVLMLICLVLVSAQNTSAATAQYSITWVTPQISATIGQCDNKSLDVHFKSKQKLSNVDVWMTPALKPFVQFAPGHFDSISAGQDYSIHITMTAGCQDIIGSYDGTLQLKIGDRTYSLPLQAKMNITKGSGVSGTIGNSGGTIEVTDPNSPIKGAKVIVPQDSIDSDLNVNISINYTDTLPGPVNTNEPNAVVAGKIIVLTKDSNYDFLLPVTVTIPYSDALLNPGDIPAVFYWDTTYNKYMSVGVKNIDTVNKTITFTTIHFTSFVPIAVVGLATNLFNVDTSFKTTVDGFFHPNYTSFSAKGGNCFGMATYSLWYYEIKKAIDGEGLHKKYLQGDPTRWDDDTIARELIARSFLASSQPWAQLQFLFEAYALSDEQTGLLLISALKITNAPQVLLMGNLLEPATHAVLVYKYENGKFYIYDNNFPEEDDVTLDWGVLGFGTYTKGGYTKFGFDSASSGVNPTVFETLYAGAEAGWPNSMFAKIDITEPVLVSDVATISDTNDVKVTGTVTGGLHQPQYVMYLINGIPNDKYQVGTVVPIANSSFTFSIPYSNLSQQENSIMIFASDDKLMTRRLQSYGGFKEFKIKQGDFFKNLGFESGDYTGWTHETHTWMDTTPGSYTPEKSGIESVGPDPIDPSIQKVYTGNYSLRINNYDWDYHISSASQSATVPNVANPQFKFY
jgi:hypothetical protein